jgi:hypothetical protein
MNTSKQAEAQQNPASTQRTRRELATREVKMAERSSILVCRRCGSHRVQRLDWVDANLSMLLGDADILSDADTYCEDCEDGTGIEDREVDVQELRRLLQLREAELRAFSRVPRSQS